MCQSGHQVGRSQAHVGGSSAASFEWGGQVEWQRGTTGTTKTTVTGLTSRRSSEESMACAIPVDSALGRLAAPFGPARRPCRADPGGGQGVRRERREGGHLSHVSWSHVSARVSRLTSHAPPSQPPSPSIPVDSVPGWLRAKLAIGSCPPHNPLCLLHRFGTILTNNRRIVPASGGQGMRYGQFKRQLVTILRIKP